jgi:hypothetical protein
LRGRGTRGAFCPKAARQYQGSGARLDADAFARRAYESAELGLQEQLWPGAIEYQLGSAIGRPASVRKGRISGRQCVYAQIWGGCLPEVRSNVTLPAGESNRAVVGPMNVSVPSWEGFPHPAGGFPLPSDSGCFARQNLPLILAQSMPQCV